jgi:hypothetical protein
MTLLIHFDIFWLIAWLFLRRPLFESKEFLTLTGWAGSTADLTQALLLHLTRTTPIDGHEKRNQSCEFYFGDYGLGLS